MFEGVVRSLNSRMYKRQRHHSDNGVGGPAAWMHVTLFLYRGSTLCQYTPSHYTFLASGSGLIHAVDIYLTGAEHRSLASKAL